VILVARSGELLPKGSPRPPSGRCNGYPLLQNCDGEDNSELSEQTWREVEQDRSGAEGRIVYPSLCAARAVQSASGRRKNPIKTGISRTACGSAALRSCAAAMPSRRP